MITVPMMGSTIPHDVIGQDGAGRVLLKPASPGTGVIAGGPVRAVVEAAGIHDVLSKSLGSSNPINMVHATMRALTELRRPEEIARLRDRRLEDIAPRPMLEAVAAADAALAAKRAESGLDDEAGG
jgi:small subunit ribosomal protein S5